MFISGGRCVPFFVAIAFMPFSISSESGLSLKPPPPYERILPPEGLEGENLGRWFADRALIYHHHYFKYGSYPDLENPTTFTEKILYKMLYDRRPILVQFADKIKVRDYVASHIGAKYLTKIYQIASTPEEIHWNSLPARYFAKANHGSGWNIFVQWDTVAYNCEFLEKMKGALLRWLNTDYSDFCGEWCYRNIPRLVYVEEDLGSEDERAIDWKFHVFDGKALYVQVHKDSRCNFYDRDLNLIKAKQHQENFSAPMVFPKNMDEMFSVADRLGAGIDYVRVDLYNIDERIVFGELTNYPHAGLAPFDPPEFDRHLGDQWKQDRPTSEVRPQLRV